MQTWRSGSHVKSFFLRWNLKYRSALEKNNICIVVGGLSMSDNADRQLFGNVSSPFSRNTPALNIPAVSPPGLNVAFTMKFMRTSFTAYVAGFNAQRSIWHTYSIPIPRNDIFLSLERILTGLSGERLVALLVLRDSVLGGSGISCKINHLNTVIMLNDSRENWSLNIFVCDSSTNASRTPLLTPAIFAVVVYGMLRKENGMESERIGMDESKIKGTESMEIVPPKKIQR